MFSTSPITRAPSAETENSVPLLLVLVTVNWWTPACRSLLATSQASSVAATAMSSAAASELVDDASPPPQAARVSAVSPVRPTTDRRSRTGLGFFMLRGLRDDVGGGLRGSAGGRLPAGGQEEQHQHRHQVDQPGDGLQHAGLGGYVEQTGGQRAVPAGG